MHKITKLKSVENPWVETAKTYDDYRDSVVNGLFKSIDEHLSPNVDYWVIGKLISPPEIGKSVVLYRSIKNGDFIREFYTSPVSEITENGFKTMNSVYLMEEVDDLVSNT